MTLITLCDFLGSAGLPGPASTPVVKTRALAAKRRTTPISTARRLKPLHDRYGLQTGEERKANSEQRPPYTHSKAPFFQIQIYPTIRMPRKIIISSNPNKPSSLNCTAHGNRKMVSTSKTTNRMATM